MEGTDPGDGGVERALSGDAPDVAAAVLAALRAGPLTGREIARRLDRASPGCLEGREGLLYPLLAALESEGLLRARWGGPPPAAPRREYALASAGGPGDAGSDPAAPPEPLHPHPRLHETARDASRGIPGDFAREAARVEMLAHLEASAAARVARGEGAEAAARGAAAAFGDTWKIRTDLRRVHRGRPVVVFPRTLGERVRSWAIYDLGPLAVLVALVVLLRWQVVQAYNIPTDSMEPTLHGDDVDPDLILVDKTVFLRRDPGRWDIIVFRPPEAARRHGAPEDEETTAFVKRCVGLGGESLDLLGGDAWVDGALARRPLDVEDAMMVPLYDLGADLRTAARRARFGPVSSMVFDASWRMRTGSWALRGAAFAAAPGPEGEARLSFLEGIDNSYTDASGVTSRHYEDVGDAEVRFVVVAGEGAAVGADLTEGADRHSLRLGPEGLVLRSGDREWTRRGVRAPPGRPVVVALRNVDDRLTVRVDGELVLREELPARSVRPRDADGAGVELVAEGGPATFSAVRILRDVHFLRLGADATWPRAIPPGHVFMMGDNAASSRDSREWGPVPVENLIGIPFAVVFPPHRARVLR